MWQPEQPSSHTVASLTRFIRDLRAAPAGAITLRSAFTISSTAKPFSASAPVGQTCTHLPQLVQLRRLRPTGWFMSLTIMQRMPRELTSQTCAPSTSAQTRTQRVQRMQRLWSST